MTTTTLREAVATQIAALSPTVEQAVIDALVTAETQKRADAIVKGIETLNGFQKELAKINKPDQVSYNADRTVSGESYSKDRLDAIEKITKKIDKLTKALDKALGGDMGDLYGFKAD